MLACSCRLRVSRPVWTTRVLTQMGRGADGYTQFYPPQSSPSGFAAGFRLPWYGPELSLRGFWTNA